MGVLDLRHRWDDGELVVETLSVVDGEKVLETEPAPFEPYCYVENQALDVEELAFHNMAVAGSGHTDGHVRVEAKSPRDVRDFAEASLAETYEADVDYSTRVCIDEQVSIDRPSEEDVLYFDIEVDDRGAFSQPSRADGRMLSIAATGGDGRERYFDDADEAEMFKAFLRFADQYAVLVGWNSVGYDFEYMEVRGPKIGVDAHWSRWVRLDLMPLYDMLAVPTKTVSLKLGDTGEREFGLGKTGVEPGGGELYDLWRDDPERLEEYNLRDTDLVRRLDEKYGLVDLLHVICDICGYPPGSACYETKYGQVRFAIGQVVDAKLLAVAHGQGVPQPNKGSHDKPDDFPGGYVLEPEPGMYESVVVPDYSGMYPNIVRAFNFGRETWYPDAMACIEEHGADVRMIRGESGVFVHPDDGGRSVPAEAADELVGMREGAPDIVDKGVKAVNNTLYGVFAADHQRYFGPHSENITLIGQRLTGVVEEIAGRGHPDIEQVVYGDTDSVMIEMKPSGDPVAAAHRIAEDLEHEMQLWAEERNAHSEHLTLDVDDVYDRFYIGDKKKRYFGHRIFDGGPCDNVKVRGFEARQGDWPEPVREFQEELMRARLDDEPVGPIIRRAKERLYEGEWDTAMAVSTTLSKPVDEYKTPLPHTRAAEMLREEFGPSAAQVGDKITYIKHGDDKTNVTWVRGDEAGRDLRPHDYGYLWRKKFKSVMRSIGVSEHQQTGLGEYV